MKKRENEDKNKKEHGVISVSLFMSTISRSQRKNAHKPSGAVKIKLLPLHSNIFDIKLVKYISNELKNRPLRTDEDQTYFESLPNIPSRIADNYNTICDSYVHIDNKWQSNNNK